MAVAELTYVYNRFATQYIIKKVTHYFSKLHAILKQCS